MATITGTTGNDTLIIQSDTTSIQAGSGTDTVVFSGNYADYTFSQSDSFVPLMTHNTTAQVVSLYGVEQLQFDDRTAELVDLNTTELFDVDTTQTAFGSARHPNVVNLGVDGYLITWTTRTLDPNVYYVFGQLLDENGNRVNQEFQVDASQYSAASQANISLLNSGGFVVVWSADEDGYWSGSGGWGNKTGIYYQMYQSDGTPDGVQVLVNSYQTGRQFDPVVTSIENGFVVVWESDGQDAGFTSGYGIYAQIYDGLGVAVGEEFLVNTFTGGSQISPAVTTLDDGNFVVSWTSYNQIGNYSGDIFAQIYDSFGNSIGGEFQVSVHIAGVYQDDSNVIVLSNDTLLFIWQGNSALYARLYDSDGIASGDVLEIYSGSSTTALNNGGFAVATYITDLGLVVKVFDSQGISTGDAITVTEESLGGPSSITATNDGGFIVVWSYWDGSQSNIFSQRFDAEGNPFTKIILDANAPALTSEIQDQSVNEENFYSFDASNHFNDVDVGDILTYGATSADGSALQEWLSINAETGVLSGVPADGQNGNIEVMVTASDIVGNSAAGTFQLEIQDSILTGTGADDDLIVQTITTTVRAGVGIDTVVFSGNYTDYTFSQSDSYVPLMTHNTTAQVVSLFGVEQLQFDDATATLTTTSSGEFQVNTYISGKQEHPSTTALNDGGFVITWHSFDQDGSGWGIYAQRYDADGSANGAEFLVNTYTSSDQYSPSTTALNDGGFVITWQSDYQDGSGWGIYAQRYDADGSANGSEFQVNIYTSNNQATPSTTALSDGGFVITWQSNNQDGSGDGIYAQRYAADGSTNGDEFQVNTYTSYFQTNPNTTTLSNGGFVITWESDGQDGSDYGIYAQRYDADGATQGFEFQVNTYTSNGQWAPSTTAVNDGGFVITWHSEGQDGSGWGIYAQRYDAEGNALGEVVLNALPALSLAISDTSTNEDATYSYDASVNFSDVDVGDTFTYSATLADDAALPSWLSINSSTGVLSGTPANGDNGAINVTVTATDSSSASVSDTYTLTVKNNILNGTSSDDTLAVLTDTTSIQAGAGTDTVVFSGNYTDYTFSQSDSFVPLMTHNTTAQVVSLFGVERFQFDDATATLTTTSSGEFQVNTYTSDSQYFPSTSALSDGGFVITWMSYDQDGDDNGIYAQRYDAEGSVNGNEFQVNTYISGKQEHPSTTALNDGGFVITWYSNGQDGDGYGVYAQRYDADGLVNGGEFQVNTYTSSGQYNPSTSALNDGGFVITWHSHGQDGSGYGIYAQRYDANGSANGNEFQVNTYTSDRQDGSSTSALNDGGFVITWVSNGQDGAGYGIYAQRYNADGSDNGGEFQVNTYGSNNQSLPSTSALNDGGFVITWMSEGQDGDDNGIYAQRYDADGSVNGAEFLVNTYTSSDQENPSTTALNDGGFVITWQSNNQDGSGWGIYAQRYDADGSANGAEFLVNTYTSSDQYSPSTTALNDGGFVITWYSHNQDGAGYGIYAQRYDAEGNALGEVVLNALPALSLAISDTSTNEDATYSYDASVNFSDVDVGDTFTYSATLADDAALPSWLSINSSTGVLSGTPTNSDTGLFNITVTATDSANATTSDTFYLTVNKVNDAPTLTGDFTGGVTEGSEVNTATGALVVSDIDGSPDIFSDVFWYSDFETSIDESGKETKTYTNPQGDVSVYTALTDLNGVSARTYSITLNTGEWYSRISNEDYGTHTVISTSSRGDNLSLFESTDGETISGDSVISGLLYTGIDFEIVEVDDAAEFSGTAINPDGVSVYLEFAEEIDRLVLTTLGDHGGFVTIHDIDTDVLYSIQDQLGTYGTLALDKNTNWIYTLDNNDPDTIALTQGQTTTDSFTIDVSDGDKTISQQIDVTVTGKDAVFNIHTTDPLTIDTTNPNIDFTLDSDTIVSDALTSLGYTSISGLSSVWNTNTNVLSVSFDGASNSQVPLVERLTGVIDANITSVAELALNAIGYSNVVGFDFDWNTTTNVMHISFSSAYNGDNVTNGDMTLTVNSEGDVIDFDGSVFHPAAGTLLSTEADLTDSEFLLIKGFFQWVNLAEQVVELRAEEGIAAIALEGLGYTNVEGLSATWNGVYNTITIEFDSANYQDQLISEARVIASTDNAGSIDYFYSNVKVDGVSQSSGANDLSEMGSYIIQMSNYTLTEIDRITADHSFTDGNISITFDNSGSTTDYSSSIKHADVGTITDSLSNLDSAEVTIIDNVYSEINTIEQAVSSIQSTTTIEDAAKFALEVLGWSQLSTITVDWDSVTNTATTSFNSGTVEGDQATNVVFVATVGNDGELTDFSYSATTSSGQTSRILASLSDTELFVSKVALKAISDLEALEVAANHTSPLHNISFDLFKDGSDTNKDFVIDNGELKMNESLDFDAVKLTDAQTYNQNIGISDAIDVLRHIVDLEVLTEGSSAFHAADTDNNGTINISDAIDILRHIVNLETIDTFDLIDSNGARVTQLDANASGEVPTWTIVANGDVDMSGSFAEDYVVSSELV